MPLNLSGSAGVSPRGTKPWEKNNDKQTKTKHVRYKRFKCCYYSVPKMFTLHPTYAITYFYYRSLSLQTDDSPVSTNRAPTLPSSIGSLFAEHCCRSTNSLLAVFLKFLGHAAQYRAKAKALVKISCLLHSPDFERSPDFVTTWSKCLSVFPLCSMIMMSM